MESLSDTKWDVVISGTGLQQSLLALALSRSDSKVLHVDSNDYYGGSEAAFSLQDADEWAARYAASDSSDALFAGALVTRHGEGLSFSRAYSLALAPQLIHAQSQLVAQLVSSRAFRQLEFLAVGSFYIYQPSAVDAGAGTLARIPSTREDIFTNTAIPARSKRSLMKFLKFVLEYNVEPQTEMWKGRGDEPLTQFLASEFKLDDSLQAYIVTLTLSHRADITVEAGLAAIHRHLTSMGTFGAGFAAVYPKWGGISEIAQVGCRAGAVGGAIYMLATGIRDKPLKASDGNESELEIALTNDLTVKTKVFVQGPQKAAESGQRLSRLVAIVNSPLLSLFETVVERSPTPAVTVAAFPAGSMSCNGTTTQHPVFAMVHSSETGECPAGQSVIYLSTLAEPKSSLFLAQALSNLLASAALHNAGEPPKCLYELAYEQRGCAEQSLQVEGSIATFPTPPLDLAFNDATLGPVRTAWNMVDPDAGDRRAEYMQFEDREGAADDDVYDT